MLYEVITEDHHGAPGHVFAGMIAGSLDYRQRPGIAHGEALAGHPRGEQLAAGGAIQTGIADHRSPLLVDARSDDDPTVMHPLADIIIGDTIEEDADALSYNFV